VRHRDGDGKPARPAAKPKVRAAERHGEDGAQNHGERGAARIGQRARDLKSGLVNDHPAYEREDGCEKAGFEQSADAERGEDERYDHHAAGKKPRQRRRILSEALGVVNAEIGKAHPLRAKTVNDQRPGINEDVVTVLGRAGQARKDHNRE
jgi:hypothetical protein